MSDTVARNVGTTGIDIAYEVFGNADELPILLIQGVGGQLVGWPEGFCQVLVDHGLHVVRFDNRDVGHSTHLSQAPAPDLPAALRGDLSSVSYTLSDMALDAVGLLDVLGISSAHVIGASMGGAIAQTMAIEHPARIRSLTSMMSTTGDMKVGQPHPDTLKALFGGPPPTTRQEVIDQQVRAFSVVGSPGYPLNTQDVVDRAARAYDRGYDPIGVARQAVASVASGDRTQLLSQVAVPTLVIHGLSDTMCDVSGGRATAAAIPGSTLVLIEGLGHNLPPGVWSEIAGHIAEVVRLGEARANAA